MRFVLMLWVTFRRMRSHVFKQSYAMAAESRKVPLEIFFNPTILSDDNLFSEFSDFFTLSGGLHSSKMRYCSKVYKVVKYNN
jgi:hypothetical protein